MSRLTGPFDVGFCPDWVLYALDESGRMHMHLLSTPNNFFLQDKSKSRTAGPWFALSTGFIFHSDLMNYAQELSLPFAGKHLRLPFCPTHVRGCKDSSTRREVRIIFTTLGRCSRDRQCCRHAHRSTVTVRAHVGTAVRGRCRGSDIILQRSRSRHGAEVSRKLVSFVAANGGCRRCLRESASGRNAN